MALKQHRPVTPGRRQLVLVDRSTLHRGKPEKALTEGLSSTGGRNNQGRITVWHRGGGHKRRYRLIDFRRRRDDDPATVERLEYDPNRSAFIALIRYTDGTLSYILAPQRLATGDTVVSGSRTDIKPGNCMPLRNMPVGSIIHNIELKPGAGGQLARSAGSYAQLLGKDPDRVVIRLVSGEQRLVRADCRATVGSVSNPDHQNAKLGKAGRSRWLGRRARPSGRPAAASSAPGAIPRRPRWNRPSRSTTSTTGLRRSKRCTGPSWTG